MTRPIAIQVAHLFPFPRWHFIRAVFGEWNLSLAILWVYDILLQSGNLPKYLAETGCALLPWWICSTKLVPWRFPPPFHPTEAGEVPNGGSISSPRSKEDGRLLINTGRLTVKTPKADQIRVKKQTRFSRASVNSDGNKRLRNSIIIIFLRSSFNTNLSGLKWTQEEMCPCSTLTTTVAIRLVQLNT